MTECQRRYHHDQRRNGDDCGHIPAAETVYEAFGRRARLLGLLMGQGCLPVVEPSFDGGDGLVEPVAGRELHGPPVTPPVGQFPQLAVGVRGELA